MRTALYFLAFAVVLRTGLFYAGVELEGFTFGFILLGMVTLMTFLSGHVELKEEPHAPMPAIFRAGLRASAVFAMLYALFLLLFFHAINTSEFPMRIASMVHDTVAGGVPEAEARRNIEAFFTPNKYAFLTFVGLLSMGAVNALIFAILQHKVLRKFRAGEGAE